VKSLIAVIVVVWLLIGVVAAAQRDYFSGSKANCAKIGTTAATIAAGPLNYVGANPKINCKKLPQPSS
jgi:nitric oxide reductase large subunit